MNKRQRKKKDKKEVLSRIVDAFEISILAKHLGLPKEWENTPNAIFQDRKPIHVILDGQGKDVMDFLRERAGQKPGAAF